MDEMNNEDTNQAVINIIKMIWERKLSSMILIGHTAYEKISLIIMFHDPLFLSLQCTMFAIGFLKLKRNFKEIMWVLQKVSQREELLNWKKRDKCMILGMCGHITVKFYF